jgi:DNA-binding FrmR family transcriptional regulator
LLTLTSHANDPEITSRLRRAEGHLAAVLRMVAEGRDGLLIAQQLQAVIRAPEKSKRSIIHDHIDYHFGEMAGPLTPELKEKLANFREITKYLWEAKCILIASGTGATITYFWVPIMPATNGGHGSSPRSLP